MTLKETEEKKTMLGEWRLVNGLFAEVIGFNALIYYGFIIFPDHKIPTFWDKSGDSFAPRFSLAEKRRSAEQKWGQDAK
jgi:hypothetical protein